MSETLSFPKLGLEFELSRVAFSIGNITIYWYGILIALAFLAGTFYAIRRCRTFGVNADRAVDVILLSAVGGVICARIYYVAFSWDYYKVHLDEVWKIWNGGIAIYGGIIGAVLTALVACKLRGVKFLPMADMAAGGLLLGQAIGRWGNFVNIEAFGSNTDLPWGMTSPSIVRYLTAQAEELSKLHVTIDPNAPVHPTFLYESLWCLTGFLLIALVLTNRRRFDGELILFYAGWYGLGRFFIEGLRTDSLMLGTIRVSQLLAAICVIAAALTWFVVRSRIKSANDPEYMKLYAGTEEAALVVSGEYYKQQAEAKKAAKAEKTAGKTDAETVNGDEETSEAPADTQSVLEEEAPSVPSDEPNEEQPSAQEPDAIRNPDAEK